MANIKSAKKDILSTARNRARNLHFRSRLRSAVKKALTAIEANAADREQFVRNALRIIDKTVSKGVIKKASAARKKSRLMARFNAAA